MNPCFRYSFSVQVTSTPTVSANKMLSQTQDSPKSTKTPPENKNGSKAAPALAQEPSNVTNALKAAATSSSNVKTFYNSKLNSSPPMPLKAPDCSKEGICPEAELTPCIKLFQSATTLSRVLTGT